MVKERKIFPSDTLPYLREKILKLDSAKNVYLTNEEKRLESIIKEIEQGVELFGKETLNYQILEQLDNRGILFKKYHINIYPENEAKIYSFELPKSAKNVKTSY